MTQLTYSPQQCAPAECGGDNTKCKRSGFHKSAWVHMTPAMVTVGVDSRSTRDREWDDSKDEGGVSGVCEVSGNLQ